MSSTAVGAIATVYLVGEVVGALVFGRLSDRLGRRNLFMVTLGIYLIGSGLTALTLGNGTGWVIYLYATRFIAGTGIWGEYAAINSAIDEMIPARYRGRVDVGVNGTYWAGAILGTLGALLFLHVLSPSLGWRIGFLIGPFLGAVILLVRRNPPESPRWLIMHGKADQAERAQIMRHRLFRNRRDAAAASAPGEARVESHSVASPNTVLHQITKGDTSGGIAADADSAEGPMLPELEAKLIAPDEMRLSGLSGLADKATAVRVIGGNPGRSDRPERSWCDWMPDNRALSAVSGRSRADGALAHRGTAGGSDGNLTYLRDHRTRRVRTPDDARGRGCLRR
jgi:hypothetical protein